MTGPFFADELAVVEPRYPEAPGYRRRETSKAAAEAMKPTAGALRERVLEAIRKRPSTADEVADRLGLSPLACRPRASELSKLGKLVDSGERRKNASGKTAIVWRAL